MYGAYIIIESYSYNANEPIGVFDDIQAAIDAACDKGEEYAREFGPDYYIVAKIFNREGKIVESINFEDEEV